MSVTDDALAFQAQLLDAVGQSVVVIDPAGKITLWNRSAEILYGRTATEAIGRDAEEVIELAEPLAEREEIQAKLFAGETWSGEFRALRPDRSRVPAFGTVTPVLGEDGSLIAIVAVTTDITEWKTVQAAAEADRQGLAAAQQLAHVGSCEVDLTTEVITPSEEFLRILGLELTDTFNTEIWMDAIHPDDSQRVIVVQEAMYEGEPTEEVYRTVRPSGEVRWVRARAVIVKDECGVPQRVIATMLDITDLHTAEAERQQAEARFRLGFERSPIGMAMAGLDESFTVVNPALCWILGRPAVDVVGHHPCEFEHAADTDAARLPLQSMLDDEALQVEHRFERPNGEVVWVQKSLSLVRDAEGAPAYLLAQFQDITARKRSEESLEHEALHDPLTGLPNRALLADRIKHSLARSRRGTGGVVALFLDVDHFKIVNDGMGHAAGDQLLVELARRLESIIRGGDTLARFGGDEFVIICDDVSKIDVQRLGKRITASMEQPFRLDGREVFVTVSVGIAVAVPGEDGNSLLSNADAAMYQAKGAGRARSVVFDESMHRSASARLDIESGLRQAIEQGELRLYYQPIVDVGTETTTGLEALLRWEHPERGIVSPLDFIPVAEDTGLIVPIGEWVLAEALTQVQSWREIVPGAEHISIAVNLSARQLLAPNLVTVVSDAIRTAGIPAGQVHLEITESVVMNDVEKSVKTLAALRRLGVRLAIDDFGTGYSSLNYLKRLPVDTLKVDRSFVDGLGGSDPHDPSIVDAIISLARALDLDVVAEGVETERQLAELRRLGAQHAQGYLWSKPLRTDDVPGWLSSRAAFAISR